MKRSLSLKRESLSELAADELGFVGGVREIDTTQYSLRECRTLPVYVCFSLYPGCSAFCTV